MSSSKRTGIGKLADQRLDADARENARYCDLQLELLDEKTGEVLGVFGGKWDRLRKDFDGSAKRSKKITLHEGQLDAARWFDRWIESYLSGESDEPKIFDSVFYGGRRGGKSALAFAIVVAFAVTVPGATVWVVVPSELYLTEPQAYLEAIMPKEWYEQLGAPHWTYYLANGSTITIRSAHVPRKLKQGKADFIMLNEGQAIPNQSYDTLSASIVDVGSMILTATNPPDVGDPGDWVSNVVAGAERGDMEHAKAFFFDPEMNPHIDQTALRALAQKYDPHTYDVQIRGLFLLTPDTVLHTWNKKDNERPIPELAGADCTREFTKFFEGIELDDIISVDVQKYPWIAAVRFRAFRNPMAPNDMEQAFMWAVGEAFVDQGDEIDCADAMIKAGCDVDRTLVIMDASCDWQQAQREVAKQRPLFKGKGSMDMFRGRGFVHVVPPDPNMASNPDVADRCRAANARIGSKSGGRFVFADPKRAPLTIASIRHWKTKAGGMPSRTSKHAHGGDCISYAIWRFFPRRGEKTKVDITAIKRFSGRDRLKGF